MPSRPASSRRRPSRKNGKRKRSRRRKKSSVPAIFTFPLVLIPILIVVVPGVMIWLGVPKQAYRLAGKAFRTITNTKSTEWPPAEGEEIYGDTFGEEIVELTEKTIRHPLRRRSIDPWLEISNASLSFDTSTAFKKAKFTFDVEKIEPAPDQSFNVYARMNKSGPFRGFFRMTSGFRFKTKKRKETVTVTQSLFTFPNAEIDPSKYQDWEIYIVLSEGEYRVNRQYSKGGSYSGPSQFKISNSLTLGSIDDLTFAREWHEKEKEYLLSKPTSELFLTFEGSEVVSTEPFELQTPESIQKASQQRRDEMSAKHEAALARMRAGSTPQESSPQTNSEFGSGWKLLKPAGGKFDLLVPTDTEMVSTERQPFGGTAIQSRVSRYSGKTKNTTLRVEWVKHSQKFSPELATQFLKTPINSLIPGNVQVTNDSQTQFQGFPARDFSIQQGEMISDAKYIAGEEFAMIVIISFRNGRPDDISTFWDSIKINGGQ